jgi:hypothetical protein
MQITMAHRRDPFCIGDKLEAKNTPAAVFGAGAQHTVADLPRNVPHPRASAAQWAGLLLLGGAAMGSAQEAVRNSIAGEKASEDRQAALESQAYNFQYGLLRFLVSSTLGFEYTDNVNGSDANPLADEIFKPQANARVYLPVTEQNALNLSLGVGYWKYLQNSQYDFVVIADGTELAFDVFVKDFRFTLYDRVAYKETPVQNSASGSGSRFGGLENTAGLKTLWDLDKLVFTADYGHESFLSSTKDYGFLNRGEELLLNRAEFRLNPLVSVGTELSGSVTRYEQEVLHDDLGYGAGLFGGV